MIMLREESKVREKESLLLQVKALTQPSFHLGLQDVKNAFLLSHPQNMPWYLMALRLDVEQSASAEANTGPFQAL